jgi:hypothetical protein
MGNIFRISGWVSIVFLAILIYLTLIDEHGWYSIVMLAFVLVERAALLVFSIMVRRIMVAQARAMLEAIEKGSGHMRENT